MKQPTTAVLALCERRISDGVEGLLCIIEMATGESCGAIEDNLGRYRELCYEAGRNNICVIRVDVMSLAILTAMMFGMHEAWT